MLLLLNESERDRYKKSFFVFSSGFQPGFHIKTLGVPSTSEFDVFLPLNCCLRCNQTGIKSMKGPENEERLRNAGLKAKRTEENVIRDYALPFIPYSSYYLSYFDYQGVKI